MNIQTDAVFFEQCGLRVLMALRRIIRAVDMYSSKLKNEFEITAPQLICLYSVSRKDGITLSELAREVNLSTSTVNGIVDRLEARRYLTRTRSTSDRRRVTLSTTTQGAEVAKAAPSLLQDRLAEALRGLPQLEQAAIALSLERVVELMEAEQIDASPNLLSAADLNGALTQREK